MTHEGESERQFGQFNTWLIYKPTDSPPLFVPLDLAAANLGVSAQFTEATLEPSTLVNMKSSHGEKNTKKREQNSKVIPSLPLSALLVALLFFGPLEMLELVLQASDLGLLLVHHWDKT